MFILLKDKTDQELADLIRLNTEKIPQQDGYFGLLKEQAKKSFIYNHECKRRGIDILTLLKNNPPT